MTAAVRLRAAVEAALPCHCQRDRSAYGPRCAACKNQSAVLRAVLPIVEELERERDALREVLRYCRTCDDDHGCRFCNIIDASLEGDWAAVRAAGVALSEEK